MLGVDNTGLGDEVPRGVQAPLQLQHPIVLDHRRATLFCRHGISPDRTCGVDITLAVGPHASEHALHADDRTAGLDLLRRHQADVINPDGLEAAVGRLKPLPPFRRGSDGNASGHMHADRLA